VLERGGAPFRQIFLRRNGAPVNIVYHSRNADTAAFLQISSYYKMLSYTRHLAKWFSGKSLKLLQPDVLFKAKMHQIRFPLGIRPRPRWGSLQRSPAPYSWI